MWGKYKNHSKKVIAKAIKKRMGSEIHAFQHFMDIEYVIIIHNAVMKNFRTLSTLFAKIMGKQQPFG